MVGSTPPPPLWPPPPPPLSPPTSPRDGRLRLSGSLQPASSVHLRSVRSPGRRGPGRPLRVRDSDPDGPWGARWHQGRLKPRKVSCLGVGTTTRTDPVMYSAELSHSPVESVCQWLRSDGEALKSVAYAGRSFRSLLCVNPKTNKTVLFAQQQCRTAQWTLLLPLSKRGCDCSSMRRAEVTTYLESALNRRVAFGARTDLRSTIRATARRNRPKD